MAFDPEVYGFDLETSGLDPHKNQIIQVGVYRPGAGFHLDVRFDPGTYEWDDEAFITHGIHYEDAVEAHYDLTDADVRLSEWVAAQSIAERKQRMMVGWNVGSFDLQFVKAQLGISSRLFAYRTVDLNSLLVLLLEAEVPCARRHKHRSWEGYKDCLKSQGRQGALETGMWRNDHHALSDAVSAYYTWMVMRASVEDMMVRA